MTFTLGVDGWAMCMTYHLVMENNCEKKYPNPFKHVEDTTQTRLWELTMFKPKHCDLDFGVGGWVMCMTHDLLWRIIL